MIYWWQDNDLNNIVLTGLINILLCILMDNTSMISPENDSSERLILFCAWLLGSILFAVQLCSAGDFFQLATKVFSDTFFWRQKYFFFNFNFCAGQGFTYLEDYNQLFIIYLTFKFFEIAMSFFGYVGPKYFKNSYEVVSGSAVAFTPNTNFEDTRYLVHMVIDNAILIPLVLIFLQHD